MISDHIEAANVFHSLYEARLDPETFLDRVKQIQPEDIPIVMFAAVAEYQSMIDISRELNIENQRLTKGAG